MNLLTFLLLLLIAGVCGAVGKAIAGFSRGGFLAAIGIGFIGDLIGSWLAGNLGLPSIPVLDIGSTAFPVVWAILGSVILVALLALVLKPRRLA